MAERRMFSKTIVLSDAFLDMPMSARCLYFTLGMLADDDGFVNSPKSIMRQCGASIDDFNVLISKRYLLCFDDGVVVIKHWRINNYLQKDRINPTTYFEHKNTLTVDEKGAYITTEAEQPLCIHKAVYTEADSVYTQYSIDKDSIDKDSIDKDSIDKVSIDKVSIDKVSIGENNNIYSASVRHKYGDYSNVLLNDEELERLKDEFPDWEKRINALSNYMASTGKKYKSHLATIRNWARMEKSKKSDQASSNIFYDIGKEEGIF